MPAKIFIDPTAIQTFHDLITDHRVGVAVHLAFLDHSGRSTNDLSYPHFTVMLKNGTFPARDLRALCQAMLDCNLDPEPCMMALYADCIPQTEPPDGDIENEFCTIVDELGDIACAVKNGTPLRQMARQDVSALTLVVGRICTAARHMTHELLAAGRPEAV